MIRISKSVEYALIAVQHMSRRHDRLTSARDLSEHFALPRGLMAKILQRLASAGILESVQGVRGGYRLARDLDGVSFLELSDAVEGPARPAACDGAGDHACGRTEVCTVSEPVHVLSARIVDLLEETKVGALLHRPGVAAGEGV
ncbi:MAG: RrF2 family transcriptional regulator [Spirochaetota bacterium]